MAESIPYERRLPDGSAAVESETAIIRAVFGYGSVKSMVAAASRSAELEAEQDSAWRMALVKMALGSPCRDYSRSTPVADRRAVLGVGGRH